MEQQEGILAIVYGTIYLPTQLIWVAKDNLFGITIEYTTTLLCFIKTWPTQKAIPIFLHLMYPTRFNQQLCL